MSSPILDQFALGFPWHTVDPFLFCVHHDDAYPKGNERFGPAASLKGRDIGQDFAGKDGWRMYHGDVVPGFPQHPHRGFETVTVVRRGLVDHADSLGAAARYGRGDVQWLTAGRGIVHAEMFPLLDGQKDNPLELFQIWLNLPRADKMAPPHFTMLWAHTIPRLALVDEAGRSVEIIVVAGALRDAVPPPPPPRSWASRPEAGVAIWSLRLAAGARFTLPRAAGAGVNRNLYVFRGPGLRVAGETIASGRGVALAPDLDVALEAAEGEGEALLLQGRPIGEPVAHFGPFVMSSREELERAFLDYRKTGFGGWPWPEDGPVHGGDPARFARHADGRLERA